MDKLDDDAGYPDGIDLWATLSTASNNEQHDDGRCPKPGNCERINKLPIIISNIPRKVASLKLFKDSVYHMYDTVCQFLDDHVCM